MRSIRVIVAVFALATACRSAKAPDTSVQLPLQNDMLHAVVWTQTSAEANALRRQTFATARAALDDALADLTWTAADEQKGDFDALPPAVIVDVDETVLDNSPLEARLIRSGDDYNAAAWKAWVEERSAGPLPGALEFAKYAESRGVTMFYVTNRNVEDEPATRDNLERAGFPIDTSIDVVLTRGENGAPSNKSGRRAIVASTHRILLLLGDDLGDFTSRAGSVTERHERVVTNADRWGVSWFVLPNPMYGSWDDALPVGPSGETMHGKMYDALDEQQH